MEVKEITEKNIWENFLLQQKEKSFLQSWAWGEFQESAQGRSASGGKIWRLGVYENNNLVAVALVVKVSARRGTFLMVQHLCDFGEEYLKILLDKIKEIGKQEKAIFVRVAPLYLRNQENEELFKKLGFKRAQMHANAYEATWKLDLSPSEDELMKNMRKTTRYLIRQAQKNPDINIEKSKNLDNIEIYQKLNREVAQRQNFVAFSDSYLKNEFEVFVGDNQASWFFGKINNEIAAGALIVFWSDIGFYHQAASLSKYSKLSIPYLLQWEAIKEAKNRGCKFYDFWGFTDPQKYPKHPWAGPTLFKMGYGGFPVEYIKTQDYVLSPKYWLIWAFELIRKRKRGLQ